MNGRTGRSDVLSPEIRSHISDWASKGRLELRCGVAELTAKWVRRGTHRELTASIRTWINNWNDDP